MSAVLAMEGSCAVTFGTPERIEFHLANWARWMRTGQEVHGPRKGVVRAIERRHEQGLRRDGGVRGPALRADRGRRARQPAGPCSASRSTSSKGIMGRVFEFKTANFHQALTWRGKRPLGANSAGGASGRLLTRRIVVCRVTLIQAGRSIAQRIARLGTERSRAFVVFGLPQNGRSPKNKSSDDPIPCAEADPNRQAGSGAKHRQPRRSTPPFRRSNPVFKCDRPRQLFGEPMKLEKIMPGARRAIRSKARGWQRAGRRCTPRGR
jgi:hypothetical protein